MPCTMACCTEGSSAPGAFRLPTVSSSGAGLAAPPMFPWSAAAGVQAAALSEAAISTPEARRATSASASACLRSSTLRRRPSRCRSEDPSPPDSDSIPRLSSNLPAEFAA